MDIILSLILIFVAIILGFAIGLMLYRFLFKKKTHESEMLANKLVQESISEAKNLRKQAITEAKEEIKKNREVQDSELRERKAEIQRSEHRMSQREDVLDKRELGLEKKETTLNNKIEAAEIKKAEYIKKQEDIEVLKAQLSQAHELIISEVEKVSQMSREDAKKRLIEEMQETAKRDAVVLVRNIENNAKEDGAKKAKEILANAIQRCAIDHSSESVISTVHLPNDEMKGRIIGREGRNIKTLEEKTGVNFIIDDTPDTVVLSAFDPVRREIARLTLTKLISDGRIQPARIDDLVEKTRKEVEDQMKEAGENAMYEAGVFNVNPELIKYLGRLKYRTSYGQNVLKHSLEVSFIAGNLAAELGADVTVAKRAGLLHDIGKAIDHEVEGTHISIGVDLAKKFKESNSVIHCIAAHHNDIDPETVEAIIIQCADMISGARPGARRESIENYVKRLTQLEEIANKHNGVEKSYAIQAGREIRIIVKPEVVDDAATVFLAREIAKEIENEMQYPGQIKVNVVRELRSIDYAK